MARVVPFVLMTILVSVIEMQTVKQN